MSQLQRVNKVSSQLHSVVGDLEDLERTVDRESDEDNMVDADVINHVLRDAIDTIDGVLEELPNGDPTEIELIKDRFDRMVFCLNGLPKDTFIDIMVSNGVPKLVINDFLNALENV